MASRSSREERSAKREALRNAIMDRKFPKSRVAKAPKLQAKPQASKRVSKPTPKKLLKANSQDSFKDSSNVVPKELCRIDSAIMSQPEISSKEEFSGLSPLSPFPELQSASRSCPEQIFDLPIERSKSLGGTDDNFGSFEKLSKNDSGRLSPMSSNSPIDDLKPSEPTIMSDEELETYLQEYEAVLSGADVPGTSDSDFSDVSSMSLSPVLEEMRYTRALSPLCLTPDSVDEETNEQPISQEELKIDDYFNFINIADTSSDSLSFMTEDIAPKRKVPFCTYQSRNDVNPVSATFNPHNRTLLAAWQTMASDVQFGTRDAYIRAVLLAAASLNQRSLISGRARETMAPALGTSYWTFFS